MIHFYNISNTNKTKNTSKKNDYLKYTDKFNGRSDIIFNICCIISFCLSNVLFMLFKFFFYIVHHISVHIISLSPPIFKLSRCFVKSLSPNFHFFSISLKRYASSRHIYSTYCKTREKRYIIKRERY